MNMSAPLDILETVDDGGKGVRVLRGGIKGYRVVTQGDPLSPTISNVVVDEVVRHWVTVMVEVS